MARSADTAKQTQYSLIDESDALVIHTILDNIYTAYIERITVLRDPSNEVIAWLAEGINGKDIYAQAWSLDHSLGIDKWSKPKTKECGHTTEKSQKIIEAFWNLVSQLESNAEVFEWIPMRVLVA